MPTKKSAEKTPKMSLLGFCATSCNTFVPAPGPRVSKKGNLYYRVVCLCTKCSRDIYDTCRLRISSETRPDYEMEF